jgi:anti-sigma factor RsiW
MDFVNHISNHNLERRYLGMITDESESAPLEEHLLACPACVEPAESTQDYMDALRAALVAIRED